MLSLGLRCVRCIYEWGGVCGRLRKCGWLSYGNLVTFCTMWYFWMQCWVFLLKLERFEAVSRTLTLAVFDGKFLTDVFIGLGRACNIFRLGKHKWTSDFFQFQVLKRNSSPRLKENPNPWLKGSWSFHLERNSSSRVDRNSSFNESWDPWWIFFLGRILKNFGSSWRKFF